MGTDGRRRAASTSKLQAAVFLDRDGTITEEVGYVNHLARVKVFPWAAEAIRQLNEAGFRVIAVTNQSGVGRGYFTEKLVRAVHRSIARELAARGARIDAFYYCPHHPTALIERYRVECGCRKPATGMLEEAARRFGLDLGSCYVIGDSYRDIQTGFNAAARTVLVLTGYGRGEYEHHRRRWPRRPDRIADDLLDAVDQILAERKWTAVRRPTARSA